MSDVPKKDAFKKIFKLILGPWCKKYCQNQTSQPSFDPSFWYLEQKNFFENFKNFNNFFHYIWKKLYFLKIIFSKNGFCFESSQSKYSKIIFQEIQIFQNFYFKRYFLKFFFRQNFKKSSWANTSEFGVENVPQ